MFTDDPDMPAKVNEFGRGTAALYVGGMGARGQNFYNEIMSAYGWEAEAKQIQDLYLDGKKDEAAAAVPAELLAGVVTRRPRGLHQGPHRRLRRERCDPPPTDPHRFARPETSDPREAAQDHRLIAREDTQR